MCHAILGLIKKQAKKIVFCLLSTPIISAYSIVFVHLGDTLPEYLVDATHQARIFNEHVDIIVIAERLAIEKKDDAAFQEDEIVFIACQDLQESDVHGLFKQKSSLTQGFWRRCTERFFLIHELMEKYDLEDVFHLEYDNMLYVDLEELLPVFHRYPNVAAVFDNDDRCIPSFVYFAHKGATKKMVTYIAQKAHLGLNDMQVIAQYKKEHNEAIGNLPIIMPEYLERHTFCSPSGHTTSRSHDYINNVNAFASIFDAAAIGQYLGGIDPRNGPSKPGFINESCLFNPSLLIYEWQEDEKGRRIPYASLDKSTHVRINNLHIHSKNLEAFKS